MKENYIVVTSGGTVRATLTSRVEEILTEFKPKGCPFGNYSMLNLLQDWLGMYAWQLPKNKPMSIVKCIERLDVDGKSIYKESMIRLIEVAA